MVSIANEHKQKKTNNKKMKTNETTVEQVKQNEVEQFLIDSIKQNEANGEVTLEQIEKSTKLERGDVVMQLRAFKGQGIYVVGRKGHKSRYLWGAAKDSYNAAVPVHSAPKHHKPTRETHIETGSSYSLQVQIGAGEKVNIPINLQLVH